MSCQGGGGGGGMMMMAMGEQDRTEVREDGSRGKKRKVMTQHLTPEVVQVMRMGSNIPGWYSILSLRHAGLKLPPISDMVRHKWFNNAVASTSNDPECE